MISHLYIKDFAIIENIDTDFYDGLNIITGETGAGKSIVVEALSLALGARADSSFVRSGRDKAVVQLAAELDGEEYLLTREISANGKNLCRINDRLATLSELGALCRRVADIHGQYDHQSLLNPENHLSLLDSYAGKRLEPLLARVREEYGEYRRLYNELSSFLSELRENSKKKDFMQFELSEIRAAKLIPGEEERLMERLALLQNSEKLYAALSAAVSHIDGPPFSALDGIGKAMRALAEVEDVTQSLKELSQDVSDIYYRLEEASRGCRAAREGIVFSQAELDECVSRLNEIERLKKKYSGGMEDILKYADELESRLSDIENSDEKKLLLTTEFQRAEKKMSASCAELSEMRKKIGEELCRNIEKELSELNFKNAAISLNFEKLLTPRGRFAYTEKGVDKAEFMLSANVGELKKPLSKIASGGEMSRIMLAFKSIIAEYDGIPTMIFDEIDSGISGVTASIVGRKLKKLAKSRQIICITHLPQIAACGDRNFKIEKSDDGVSSRTNISPLDHDEKVREIARLLGGLNISETTLKSAAELIEASNSSRASL